MKRVNLIALRSAIAMSTLLLIGAYAASQIVGPPSESDCNRSGTVMVTVSDSSGAVIPNAFLLFRADRCCSAKGKAAPLELWTNSEGKVTASVPCGYVDFFVAADGFTPHAEKMLINKNASSASLRLEVAKMVEE